KNVKNRFIFVRGFSRLNGSPRLNFWKPEVQIEWRFEPKIMITPRRGPKRCMIQFTLIPSRFSLSQTSSEQDQTTNTLTIADAIPTMSLDVIKIIGEYTCFYVLEFVELMEQMSQFCEGMEKFRTQHEEAITVPSGCIFGSNDPQLNHVLYVS